MKLRKGMMGVVASAVAVTLALAGCGSSGDNSGSTGGAALPDDQQNLTYVPNFGVQSLDVTKYPLEIGVQSVSRQVEEPLVKISSDNTIVPGLADSWEWTDDTTLVFHLHPGVTFSDGSALTSTDVKNAVDAYIAANGALAVVLNNITSTTATDANTFTLTTKQKIGTLLGVFNMLLIFKTGTNTGTPIGTGPFKFTDYVANDHVSEVRNDSYWGTKAQLKTLTFSLITDSNAKLTALSNNQVQAVQDLTNDQLTQIAGTDGVTVQTAPSYTYYFVWFENAHGPLANPLVRKAMFEAIDRDTVQQTLFGDTAKTMISYCPSTAFGCLAPADGLPKYDPADAKALLAQAGYPDGFTIDMIWNTSLAAVNNYAQAFIAQWKQIGVTVTPRAEDATTWNADFAALKWDMDTQASQDITGDADYVLNRLYSCAAKRMEFCDPALDSLMTQAQQETDASKRTPLYQQINDTFATDLPAIPLWEATANVAERSNVKGIVIPPSEMVDFSGAYLAS